MDDTRFGTTIRMARIRRGWRQQDLAEAADVCRETISLVERGHLGSYSIDLIRRVCLALEIRLSLVPRWRGGELDRMLALRHSRLHESVARAMARDAAAWTAVPEVSFNIYGERGVIDLVLWHPGRRALLVMELKTELVDANELLGTMDRKRRLARRVVRDRGWEPAIVSGWIILAGSRTNERRVAEHRTMLRAAYPSSGRAIGSWLRDPVGSIAALSMWPTDTSTGPTVAPTRRVRRTSPVPGRSVSPTDVARRPR